MTINGKQSKFIYEKVIDFDLAALYPSIIRACNIDTTTQYGRLIMNNITPSKENDPAMDFIDKLTTNNHAKLATEYYNAPTITDMARSFINNNYILPDLSNEPIKLYATNNVYDFKSKVDEMNKKLAN